MMNEQHSLVGKSKKKKKMMREEEKRVTPKELDGIYTSQMRQLREAGLLESGDTQKRVCRVMRTAADMARKEKENQQERSEEEGEQESRPVFSKKYADVKLVDIDDPEDLDVGLCDPAPMGRKQSTMGVETSGITPGSFENLLKINMEMIN
jgi:hypothetical protein